MNIDLDKSANSTIVKEASKPRIQKIVHINFETDVLVVGGGYAGVFAALRAAEKGMRVLVVDKGIVGKSGYSPWAHTFKYFDASLGDIKEDWINGIEADSEYTTNRDYINMYVSDSLARYNDLVAWGIITPYPKDQWDEKSSPGIYNLKHANKDRHLILRKKLVDRSITLIERVMLTDLLIENGQVMGAMGFPMENEQLMIFRARATILCTGAGSYMPTGYPTGSCTFDGDAMAYRAGASIAGKEYIDFHGTLYANPGDAYNTWGMAFLSPVWPCGGTPITGNKSHFDALYEVDKNGNSPPGPRPTIPATPNYSSRSDPRVIGFPPIGPAGLEQLKGGATGMGVHKSEGIFPSDSKCFSGIPGLYAAGDALASMLCGSKYTGGVGTSASGSCCQGYRAAEAAVEYSKRADKPKPSNEEIDRITERIMAPRERQKGFDPRWCRDVLLTTMSPYYILYIKEEPRLQGALKNIEYIRDHIVNKLRATNPHEARLCHELENKVLNAEMKLRASLMRTESRGSHYRRDYPARNDKEWLAWILINKDKNNKMVLTKKPVPSEWVGDLTMPYKERYPVRFPGELEYLGLN